MKIQGGVVGPGGGHCGPVPPHIGPSGVVSCVMLSVRPRLSTNTTLTARPIWHGAGPAFQIVKPGDELASPAYGVAASWPATHSGPDGDPVAVGTGDGAGVAASHGTAEPSGLALT